MSDKRVVLGISYSQDLDLGQMIEDELEELGVGEVECVLAHTKAAVETFLSRDSSIVGVILLRDMSVSSPYTAREMVMLAERYPKVVFVPICAEVYKGSSFAQELLEGGVYNMIFNCDSNLKVIASRIAAPLSRREARRYYDLMGNGEKKVSVGEENQGLSDENYYSYLEFLEDSNEENFSSKLNYIKGILDDASFRALLLRLPEEMKVKVSGVPGYENTYAESGKVVDFEKRKRSPRDKAKERKETDEKEKTNFWKEFSDASSKVFGKFGAGIRDVVKGSTEEEELKGIKKFFARTNKEFESLEQTLIDELESDNPRNGEDSEKTKETVAGHVSEKLHINKEAIVLEEDDSGEGVMLQELSVELREEPAEENLETEHVPRIMTEVVVMEDVIEESGEPIPAVEVVECVKPVVPEKEAASEDIVKSGRVERKAKKKEEKEKKKEEKIRNREEKAKPEKIKPVYIGSVVIAVASIKKGIGCSHVARAFANYMYQVEKRRTCFIDCEKVLYAVPEGLLNGIDVLSFSELAIAYNRYDCIVMDIGTDCKKYRQEIVRATVKVMCCTADDVVIENLYRFMKQELEPGAWIYAYNHVLARAKKKKVEALMEDYKYVLVPACSEEELPKVFVKDIRRMLSGKLGG